MLLLQSMYLLETFNLISCFEGLYWSIQHLHIICATTHFILPASKVCCKSSDQFLHYMAQKNPAQNLVASLKYNLKQNPTANTNLFFPVKYHFPYQ